MKWGLKRKYENGGISIATTNFMGYDMGPEGKLVINEEQAVIVRLIFNLFLRGYSYNAIANHLTKKGIKTMTGKNKWLGGVIKKMLENEKYAGNTISQKTYTEDYLTHKRSKNIGQMPKYTVQNSHEAIIAKDVFMKVQAIIHEKNDSYARQKGDKAITAKYINNIIKVW